MNGQRIKIEWIMWNGKKAGEPIEVQKDNIEKKAGSIQTHRSQDREEWKKM